MSLENKVRTRSSYNTSKVKESPEVTENASEVNLTCSKEKVSQPPKKTVSSPAKRLAVNTSTKISKPKASKRNIPKKNLASIKLAEEAEEKVDREAIGESAECLPVANHPSTLGSENLNLPKVKKRVNKRKKDVSGESSSKNFVTTDSSSLDGSLPDFPVLRLVSKKSRKNVSKRKRISSSDSQESPATANPLPLRNEGGLQEEFVGEKNSKKSPRKKKEVCFSADSKNDTTFDIPIAVDSLPLSSKEDGQNTVSVGKKHASRQSPGKRKNDTTFDIPVAANSLPLSSKEDSQSAGSVSRKHASRQSPRKKTKVCVSASNENYAMFNIPDTVDSLPQNSKQDGLHDGSVGRENISKKSHPKEKGVSISTDNDSIFSTPSTEFSVPASSFSGSNISESSPKVTRRKRKLTVSCEQQSTSSESELNNKEFFIISDSELNNYMNSDQELNLPISASSEEEKEHGLNLNVSEGVPEADAEGKTAASASEFTCVVYKDPQLSSLQDGVSHAVVIDQTKMLASLNYYLTEKNFSFEQSPTKKIGPTLNEIHPDLFLSPPSAEVVANLQLFTKDKEFDSALEVSPKTLNYGNMDPKTPMALYDSRLLDDVSLSYDPSVEELVKKKNVELPPSQGTPKLKKGPKKIRGKSKKSPGKNAAGRKHLKKKRKLSQEFGSSQEENSDLVCSADNPVESGNTEVCLISESATTDNCSNDPSHNTEHLTEDVVPSHNIERKQSIDDSDKLIIFTDDENLDFEPETEYPSCAPLKNQTSSENSKAKSPIIFSTDHSKDLGLNNVQSSGNPIEISVKDTQFEVPRTPTKEAADTIVSKNTDGLVYSLENGAIECNNIINEKNPEQANFVESGYSNKPPETDLETELEEEEAWSLSEAPSPEKSDNETASLKNMSPQDNTYSGVKPNNSKQSRTLNRRTSVSDGDSDSESEHSFKRREHLHRLNNERPIPSRSNAHGNQAIQDPCDTFSTSTSVSRDKSYDSPAEGYEFALESPPAHRERYQDKLNNEKTSREDVRNVVDVLQRIVNLCEMCNIIGAIEVAKYFMTVGSEDAKERIFQELFWHVMGYITHPACPGRQDKKVEMASSVLDIFHNFKLNHRPNMCSMVIWKCLKHPLSSTFAVDVFDICQKQSIPLSESAIVCYSNYLMSKERSLETYLTFLEYIKKCGEFALPRAMLHRALQLFLDNQEVQFLPRFKRLSDLFSTTLAAQVGEEDVKGFAVCCIENNYWPVIVSCFEVWSNFSKLCHILSQVFARTLQSAGIYYAKFAAALHDGVDSLPVNLSHLFGQIGVMLMLEAYAKEEAETALEILNTMHQYKVNYYDLQSPLYQMDYLETLSKVSPESLEPVYCFTVTFAAVDVFMQNVKPKTAFSVLQGFSKSVPPNLNERLRSKITPQLYRYFLKLSQILHQVDPLYKGLEALNAFLSALEKHANPELKGVTISNMNDLRTVFLQNSVSLLNAKRVREAFDLFHRCEKLFKDDLKPQKFVVRGLLTAVCLNEMQEEAQEMFSFGWDKKIYTPAKLDFNLCAWVLMVEFCWTKSEIKLVLEKFLQDKERFFILQKRCMMGEEMLALRIQFKPDPKEFCSELTCLKVPSTFDEALKRVGLELKIIDPNFKWRVDSTAKAMQIAPSCLLDFWKRKFPERKEHKEIPNCFLIKGQHRYSFGADFLDLSPPPSSSTVTSQSPVNVSPTVTSQSPVNVSPTAQPSLSPTVLFKKPSSSATTKYPHNVSPTGTTKHLSSISSSVTDKHTDSITPITIHHHTVTAKNSIIVNPTVTRKPISTVLTTDNPPSVSSTAATKPFSRAVTAKPALSTTTQPSVCARPTLPVKQRHQKPQVPQPVQTEPVIKNQEEFQKVVLFVKARVFLKCKHLSPHEQETKAINLAKAFISEYKIESKLDKKNMKLLNDYTEKNINL